MSTFADRLKIAINNEPVTAIAKKAGMSEGVLRRYLSGDTLPGLEKAKALADALGVSFEWLAVGKADDMKHMMKVSNEQFAREMHIRERQRTDNEGLFAAIKIMPVTASAGGGAAPGGEAACGTFPLAHQWLHQHNLNAADLFMVDGAGDSMEPTILNGEKLLCSKAEHHLNGDGIFVFRQEGDVLVKRLQRQPGIIKVISDNDAYLPYDIPLNDGVEFQIIGKVLFKHSLMPV